MALTLLTAITATDTVFDVLGSDDLQTGDFKTIDSETIVIRRAQVSTLAYGQSARQRVSVYRGSGGTRAAAHAANASLATYSGGGSGGVTVDNGSDPPAAVTTLVAPGAVIADGSATLPLALTMRQFDVAFDDAGFIDPNTGVILWTPAAGDVVMDLWATVSARFLGADSALLYIGGNVNFDQLLAGAVDLIGVGLPPDASQDFVNAPGSLLNATLDAAQSSVDIDPAGASTRSLQRVPTQVGSNGTDIIAAVTVTNGPLTAGALRVTAIVGTPAS